MKCKKTNCQEIVLILFKVFPPAFRELPPPPLELFDLDETFSSEKTRLAEITNKCKQSKLIVYTHLFIHFWREMEIHMEFGSTGFMEIHSCNSGPRLLWALEVDTWLPGLEYIR